MFNAVRDIRYFVFRWRCSLPLTGKLALSFCFAVLTGIAAQIKFYLPWTPVPITLQTLWVLLSGVLLGKWWGGISQIIYVTTGVIGLPWFAGFKGGLSALLGPTGGYLMGFVLAAFFMGYVCDSYLKFRKFVPVFLFMLFANFILIYVPGLLHLFLWLKISGMKPDFAQVIAMGALPFILGDILKIVVASVIAVSVLPKVAFNGEIDA